MIQKGYVQSKYISCTTTIEIVSNRSVHRVLPACVDSFSGGGSSGSGGSSAGGEGGGRISGSGGNGGSGGNLGGTTTPKQGTVARMYFKRRCYQLKILIVKAKCILTSLLFLYLLIQCTKALAWTSLIGNYRHSIAYEHPVLTTSKEDI